MSGEIIADRLLAHDGQSGLFLNSSTQQVELVAGGFNLAFQALAVSPVGKSRVTFQHSSSDQAWVVPTGVEHVFVKMWGSGGGGGHYGGWSFGSHGGGGGFSRGIIPVTAGETLTVRVPRGGYSRPSTTRAPFGGGSATSSGDNQYGAGGGGYTGVFRASTPLMIAGGGGGGGSTLSDHGMCDGGAGGGLRGLRGEVARNRTQFAGGGGTQTAGGAGGTGTNTLGQAGSSLQGGSVQGNNYGGGGGGGFFGGGSGSYGDGNTMAGGGGGSGHLAASVIMGATFAGRGRLPAGVEDPDYPGSSPSLFSSIGFGGVQNTNGGDGYVVIYY